MLSQGVQYFNDMENPPIEQPFTNEFVFNAHTVAQEHYINLPYHNFKHAQDVFDEAMHLADYCEANGVIVNRRVLTAAALLHDAGYHEDSSDRFDTKEKYSKFLAADICQKLGMSDEETEAVGVCIMGTEPGQDCPSIESKIIRRSDLANFAGPWRKFIKKSLDYAREEIQLKGINIAWSDICGRTTFVASLYLDEENLSLGDFDKRDKNGTLVFIAKSWKNIDRMHVQNRNVFSRARAVGHRALQKLIEK